MNDAPHGANPADKNKTQASDNAAKNRQGADSSQPRDKGNSTRDRQGSDSGASKANRDARNASDGTPKGDKSSPNEKRPAGDGRSSDNASPKGDKQGGDRKSTSDDATMSANRRAREASGGTHLERWDKADRAKRGPEGFEHFKKTIGEANDQDRASRGAGDTDKPKGLDRNAAGGARSPDVDRRGKEGTDAKQQDQDRAKNDARISGDKAKGGFDGKQKDQDRSKTDNQGPGDKEKDSKKDQGDKLSESEKAERQRMSQKTDGIPFAHNSDQVKPADLKRFTDTLTPDQIKSLQDGKSSMTVEAGASRDGQADYNQQLSDSRAISAADAIAAALNIPRDNIKTVGVGESDARDAGHPDGKDNADDRFAVITIQDKTDISTKDDKPQPPDLDGAIKSARDALPPSKLDNNAGEQGKMLLDAAEKLGKSIAEDAIKNPAAIEASIVKNSIEQSLEYGKQQGLWMLNKLAQDFSQHDLLANIQANAVPGMQDALAQFAGLTKDHYQPHQNPLFKGERSEIYRLARDAYRERLDNLPAKQAENLRNVMRSSERHKLDLRVGDTMLGFGSRGTVQ